MPVKISPARSLLSKYLLQSMSSAPLNALETLRGRLPDLYFVNASSAQMGLHAGLLTHLPQENRIIEFMQAPGTFLTELSLCAYDEARPGLLAKICGALAVLKVKVHTASVFTLREEKPIVLDTLQISDSYLGHDRRLAKAKHPKIRAALEEVLSGTSPLHQILHRPLNSGALKVHEVQCESVPLTDQKMITIHTSKNHMAVFRMASAMASLGLDIQAAQIHQGEKDTHGVFFVTGQIEESLDYQLRFALQSHSVSV